MQFFEFLKKVSFFSVVSIFCSCYNSVTAAVLPFNLTTNYPGNTETISGDFVFNPNCNCYSKTALPIVPIKVLVWLWKIPTPAYSPPDPSQSLLGIAGYNISGDIFMGNQPRATFEESYNNGILQETLNLSDNLSDIPATYTPPFSLDIVEKITGVSPGIAIGEGSYSVNGNLISSYTVNYSFDGNPSGVLANPITRNALFTINPSSDPNYVTVSGKITGNNFECIPEPSSTLGILALGLLGAGATLKRKTL